MMTEAIKQGLIDKDYDEVRFFLRQLESFLNIEDSLQDMRVRVCLEDLLQIMHAPPLDTSSDLSSGCKLVLGWEEIGAPERTESSSGLSATFGVVPDSSAGAGPPK